MQMHVKVKALALAAVLLALCVVCMALTQFLPTMRLAFAGLACFAMMMLALETGPFYALIAYASGAALCVLFVPMYGWLFVGFFGWYPSVKMLIERMRSRPLQWVCKLGCFLAAFSLLYFLVTGLAGALFPRFAGMPALLFAAGTAGFVLFDLLLTKFISWYLIYLRPKLGMNRG